MPDASAKHADAHGQYDRKSVGRGADAKSVSHAVVHSASQEKILKKRGYSLGRLLGEGSYAKVYQAEYTDPNTKKTLKLACKLIDGTQASKEFLRKFFPREIEIMSKVNHQYLIRVHSILERKQKYFMFMQYADNGDLLDFIRAHGPIKEKQARIWFAQVVKGLTYLHEKDIAHRDMKCENLLLTAAYNIKISDFGFARYATEANGKAAMSTTFCGSVSYAPPEIIRGTKYNCKLADLWSIGIILYVMINKAMPFDDGNLKKLYDSQVNRLWKVRSKLKDILSLEVKKFLYVLLEPVPTKRLTLAQIWNDPWLHNQSSTSLGKKDNYSQAIYTRPEDMTVSVEKNEDDNQSEAQTSIKRSTSAYHIHETAPESQQPPEKSSNEASGQRPEILKNLSPLVDKSTAADGVAEYRLDPASGSGPKHKSRSTEGEVTKTKSKNHSK